MGVLGTLQSKTVVPNLRNRTPKRSREMHLSGLKMISSRGKQSRKKTISAAPNYVHLFRLFSNLSFIFWIILLKKNVQITQKCVELHLQPIRQLKVHKLIRLQKTGPPL